jgi:hypothetical protein
MTTKCKCGKDKRRRHFACLACWVKLTIAEKLELERMSGRKNGKGSLRLDHRSSKGQHEQE